MNDVDEERKDKGGGNVNLSCRKEVGSCVFIWTNLVWKHLLVVEVGSWKHLLVVVERRWEVVNNYVFCCWSEVRSVVVERRWEVVFFKERHLFFYRLLTWLNDVKEVGRFFFSFSVVERRWDVCVCWWRRRRSVKEEGILLTCIQKYLIILDPIFTYM